MTTEEEQAYDAIQSSYGKYWIPIRWAVNIINQARVEKRIQCDYYAFQMFKVKP
jgi:acyl-ACP thioesterase